MFAATVLGAMEARDSCWQRETIMGPVRPSPISLQQQQYQQYRAWLSSAQDGRICCRLPLFLGLCSYLLTKLFLVAVTATAALAQDLMTLVVLATTSPPEAGQAALSRRCWSHRCRCSRCGTSISVTTATTVTVTCSAMLRHQLFWADGAVCMRMQHDTSAAACTCV